MNTEKKRFKKNEQRVRALSNISKVWPMGDVTTHLDLVLKNIRSTQNRNMLIEKENRLMAARGEGVGGWVKELRSKNWQL